MRYMSFGDGAGHLMERLLENTGVSEENVSTVLIQPEGYAAALQLLREAAEGGWVVELLDAEDEPGTGEGDTIKLAGVANGEICGTPVDDDGDAMTTGWLRLDLNRVEKVHIF